MPRELPDLLAHYRARLVAFPSACPETFCFTLSEAWAAGMPVVVPPIGALAERVAGTGAGWVLTEAEWRDEARMLRAHGGAPRSRSARAGSRRRERARAAAAADARGDGRRARSRSTTRRSTAHARRARAVAKPLAPARVLAALGYEPWHPPRRADGPVRPPPRPSARAASDDAAPTAHRPPPRRRRLHRQPRAGAGGGIRCDGVRRAAIARSAGSTGGGARVALRQHAARALLRRLTPDAILAALKARLF